MHFADCLLPRRTPDILIGSRVHDMILSFPNVGSSTDGTNRERSLFGGSNLQEVLRYLPQREAVGALTVDNARMPLFARGIVNK